MDLDKDSLKKGFYIDFFIYIKSLFSLFTRCLCSMCIEYTEIFMPQIY